MFKGKHELLPVPKHVAIIADGDRTWARKRRWLYRLLGKKFSLLMGHELVAKKRIEELTLAAKEMGIMYLTFWVFSTENWKRNEDEVQGLMDLFRQAFTYNAERLHELGVKLETIGDLSRFPADIQKGICKWVELTKDNTGIEVIFALNYGGRAEIKNAVREASEADAGEVGEVFQYFLETRKKGIPDPELVIRTGGEQRLSGFMLYQLEYAELMFPKMGMPAFTAARFRECIQRYRQRHRRFGK